MPTVSIAQLDQLARIARRVELLSRAISGLAPSVEDEKLFPLEEAALDIHDELREVIDAVTPATPRAVR